MTELHLKAMMVSYGYYLRNNAAETDIHERRTIKYSREGVDVVDPAGGEPCY